MKSDKMKDYLPDYYRDSRQMNAIMETEGQELDALERNIQDIEKQMTIQKATWKIPTYEEIFAVTTVAGDTLEQRRARLLSKLRLRSPTTRKEFIRFLLPFADSVEIEQHFSEYLVEFFFSGMKASFEAIDKLLYWTMPAHLDWKLHLVGTFEFGDVLHYEGGFEFSSLPRKSEFISGFGFSVLKKEGGFEFSPNPVQSIFEQEFGFSNQEGTLGGAFFIYVTDEAVGGKLKYPATEFDIEKGFSNQAENTGGFFSGLYMK